MKLITHITPTHQHLHDEYFEPSVSQFNEFELVAIAEDQICESGVCAAEGWDNYCYRRTEVYYEQLKKASPGELLLFSDTDVIFLKPAREQIIQEMGDYDIIMQRDCTPRAKVKDIYCCGFFCARACDSIIKLFETMLDKNNYEKEDQTTLNKYIHTVKSKHFSSKFYNISHAPKYKVPWDGMPFLVPDQAIIFHANWVKGVAWKDKMLEYVSNFR